MHRDSWLQAGKVLAMIAVWSYVIGIHCVSPFISSELKTDEVLDHHSKTTIIGLVIGLRSLDIGSDPR